MVGESPRQQVGLEGELRPHHHSVTVLATLPKIDLVQIRLRPEDEWPFGPQLG